MQEVQDRFKRTLAETAAEQMTDELVATLAQQFLQEKEGKNYEQMHEEVYATKLFQLIQEHITITPQTISAEDFEQLVHEQHSD